MKKYLPVTCNLMSNDFWLQAAVHIASPVASHYVSSGSIWSKAYKVK